MKRILLKLAPLLLAIAGLLILFRIWVPNLLTSENLLDLAQQISINAILAFGMTLVIMIGGIDLSVGALLALVGTATVFALNSAFGMSHPVFGCLCSMAAGLLIAAAFGMFTGTCAAKTKIPPFIITLSTMMIARGLALRFNEGRPIPIPDSQSFFLGIGNGRIMDTVPVPIVIMLVAFTLTTVLLHFTKFGRHLYAIGGNFEAARLSGIPIVRNIIVVYVICGLLTGVAGMIHTAQLYSAEPASGVGFELNAIAAVVVGGTSFSGGIGTMPGTLLGAIIIGILDKGLNQAGVHYSLQYVVKGLVILGAVYADGLRRK